MPIEGEPAFLACTEDKTSEAGSHEPDEAGFQNNKDRDSWHQYLDKINALVLEQGADVRSRTGQKF